MVVFELSHLQLYTFFLPYALFLVFLLIAIHFIHRSICKLKKPTKFNLLLYRFSIIFLLVLLIAELTFSARIFLKTKKAISQINVMRIVGSVDNFQAAPCTGHKPESFEIDGVIFAYSHYEINPFFHHVSCKGGPINQNGQKVKIDYIELDGTNRIIKLYVFSDKPTID